MRPRCHVPALLRLTAFLGFTSVAALCRGLDLSRQDLYRAVGGDEHARRRVARLIGPTAEKVLLGTDETLKPDTSTAATDD